MTEYIKREDAIQTLEQTQWHDEEGYLVDDADERRRYSEDWVNCMPTVDIVHCGECKHRREHTEYDRKHDEYVTYAYCTQWQSYHCDDWFCADGERKSDD